MKRPLMDGVGYGLAWTQAVFFTLLFSHLVWLPYAHAGPQGGNVTGGSGTINHSGNQTTIQQNSQNMAIDWSSYNVGVNERVLYNQPNSSSLSLNRILDNAPSNIQGRIDANGQIILINPNGVFFSPTSVINVGGIIASGLDMSSDDFMNGDYIFKHIPGTEGKVANSGLINAATGGHVTLLGKQVKNDGLIVANLGMVNLAAGKTAVLRFDDSVIGIEITEGVLQDELGLDPAVLNSGTINAEGGQVLLTASASQDVFSQIISVDLVQATSVVVNADGSYTFGRGADVVNTGDIDVSNYAENAVQPTEMRIVLLGENVTHSGTLKADNINGDGGDIELHARDTTLLTEDSLTSARSEANGQGGVIKVLGDIVGVTDQSMLDASGANGGGEILVGGDFQGKNESIRNARFTYVSTDSRLMADALQQGDGGKIINWADDTTGFYGTASARGGVDGGDGGLVEISGKLGLSFNGWVDNRAPKGTDGTLLFDPQNIVIHDKADGVQGGDSGLPGVTANSGNAESVFHIGEQALEDLVAGTSINLRADGNITINNLVDNTLDLKTNNTNSVTFRADLDTNGSGDFIMHASDTIRTQGGAVNINAASITAGHINTTGAAGSNGGAITLATRSGSLRVQSLTSSGGAATTNGLNAGNITLETGDNTGVEDQITINGNLTANGSDAVGANVGGNAGQIFIETGNTTGGEDRINLNGNISAQGGNSTLATNIGLNNNIEIDTPELRTSGTRTITTARSRSDANTNSTDIYIHNQDGSTNYLTDIQLGSNLTLTAGASDRVRLTADVNYGGASARNLIVNAGDDISLYSIDASSGAGALNVALNANQDGNSVGDVTLGELTGDNSYTINTGGGTFNASGVHYNGGSSTGSDATHKLVNTGGNDITINMTGTATLGEIRARNLTVSARAVSAAVNSIHTGTSGDDIILTGQADFTSTLGRINLINSNNNFNNITVNSTGNVSLLDSSSTVSIQGSITGDLNLTSTASSPVTVITNSDALSVTANSTFTAEAGHSIDVSDVGNDFTGSVTFIGNGGNLNSITVADSSNITLQDAFNLDGNLTVDATNITLNDTNIGGHLDLDAVNTVQQAAGQQLTVAQTTTLDGTTITFANNSNNDFQGAVNVNNAAAVVNLRDSTGGIQLGGASPFVSNTLTVRADNGDITQGNTITSGATLLTVDAGQSIDLGNTGNVFSSTVSYNGISGNINNLTIADSTALLIQNGLTLDGDLIATASALTLGNLTVGADGTGNLMATSTTGQINELNTTSQISVAGITDLQGGSGGIFLDNLNHDFQGEVRLRTTAGNVSIRDANTLQLGRSDITGTLTARADTLTQIDGVGSDGMTVTGLSTFIVPENSDITLENVDNQFGAIAFSAPVTEQFLGSVSVINNGSLDLQSLRVTNTLTARSINGDITNSGGLIVNGDTNVRAANIELLHVDNDFENITVVVNEPTTGNVQLRDVDGINFIGESNINDITVTTTSGDITDTDGVGHSITSNGIASFIGAQDVVLDSGNHNFNELRLVSGRDATVNAVSISDLGTSNVTRNLSIETDGNIVNNSGALDVGGTASFIAADGGNIELNHTGNRFVQPISLSSSGTTLNNVAVTNTVATQVNIGNNITGDLDITSGGDITSGLALVVGGITTLSASGQRIALSHPNNDFNVMNVTAADRVEIVDRNAIAIGSINATSTTLTATNGAITDANGDALNLVGDSANLNATGGVGADDALETQLANLTVANTAGAIGIHNTGNITVNLQTSGDIDLTNTGDVTIDLLDSTAGGDTHSLMELTVTDGAVFGAEPQTFPDIRGHDVTVIVNDGAGNFGTAARPVYLDVHGNFTLLANISSYDFSGDIPSDIVDNSSIRLSISNLFALISSQKLIEVESLLDLDPAIFTDVRNFYHDDLAILLPPDQRYSEDDEEERRQAAGK